MTSNINEIPHLYIYYSYGFQITRALRDLRKKHRAACVKKLEVPKEHKDNVEEVMRMKRRKLIVKAMTYRQNHGSYHLRARSYFERLQQIDVEDRKGGQSVPYVEINDEDEDATQDQDTQETLAHLID